MKARLKGPSDISANFERINMEAEASSIWNLEVEKLKPEDIPVVVIENESLIGKWTVGK